MKYSVFVPLGYASTWLSRKMICDKYEIEPVNDKQVNLGYAKANMGSYWLLDRKVLVLPTSSGFDDEGGINKWAGDYMNGAEKIVGLGWCGSQRENNLGGIVVPSRVALSPGVKRERSIMGNSQSDKKLRSELIRIIETEGYKILKGKACTYMKPEEPIVSGMVFGDMEAGLLIRYGNQRRIPTACVYVVSDDKTEKLPEGKKFEKVSKSFFDRITSSPLSKSFEISLYSVMEALSR
jgi:hypothetical protein